MQLLTTKTDGLLKFDGVENTFEEEIALELDEDIDNVKVTMSFLQSVGLLELVSDTELMLPDAVKSIGKECDSAERVRRHRDKTLQCNRRVTKCNTEIEIEKEIEIYKEKPKQQRFMKPTVEEVRGYLKERGITSFKPDAFIDYYESKGWMIGKNPMKDWRAAVRTWERNANEKTPTSKPVIDLPVEKRDWYVPEEERVDPAEVEGLLAAIGIRR
jgi:hypothetical protein